MNVVVGIARYPVKQKWIAFMLHLQKCGRIYTAFGWAEVNATVPISEDCRNVGVQSANSSR